MVVNAQVRGYRTGVHYARGEKDRDGSATMTQIRFLR